MSAPVPLILDTDLDTDCDDAGALAVLHTYVKQGRVDLLGIVCSLPVPWCAPCVRRINAAYGRPEIPVGAMRLPDWDSNPAYADYHAHRQRCTAQDRRPLYNQHIAQQLPFDDPVRTEDAVGLYRRLLARADDGSVTLCGIGTLTALDALLQSGPDEFSPLPGRALAARKIRQLVLMAVASFPAGADRFNWKMDLPAAARTIAQWPGDLAVNEWGDRILTGRQLRREMAPEHPVRMAYDLFLGETPARPSWDQMTVLYAVEGAAAGFGEQRGLRLELHPQTGEHRWLPGGPDGRHTHLALTRPDEEFASRIEELMLAAGQ